MGFALNNKATGWQNNFTSNYEFYAGCPSWHHPIKRLVSILNWPSDLHYGANTQYYIKLEFNLTQMWYLEQ